MIWDMSCPLLIWVHLNSGPAHMQGRQRFPIVRICSVLLLYQAVLSPVNVPVLDPNLSASMPMRWSMLT